MHALVMHAHASPNPPSPPTPPARENMMMRFSKVSPDGVYTPPPPANAKASYATMVYVRADIVRNAGERGGPCLVVYVY